MLRFLHHNQLIEEPALAADVTILDYLREHKNHSGTKEGCASGDCGACTVVIASAVSKPGVADTLEYLTANSCITFVGALHGKQLITVENLLCNQALHPSQQGMVDSHGSQCGFCTPGFVMSIFGAMKNADAVGNPNRETIDQQLGGNLCRCTGYRPIIDATHAALLSAGEPDHFDTSASATIESLKKLAAIEDKPTTGFYRPRTVSELCQLKKDKPDAVILGGGTDLALRVTQNLDALPEILSIGAVNELDFFTIDADVIRFGAGLSLSAFRQNMIDSFPQLEDLLVRFAGTQVRNQATVGGNFANASPVGDLPPVLIALNAKIVLQSVDGQRIISADDFFTSYKVTQMRADEFIREFSIAKSAAESQSENTRVVNRFYKISKRLDDDISCVCAAFHLEIEGEKLVSVSTGFGGMAEIPKRASALESVLTGNVLDNDCLKAAAAALQKDFSPIDDVRASAAYRMRVAQNLLTRLATELYTPEVETTVVHHGHQLS